MKIALIGKGKMGQAVSAVAQEQGDTVVALPSADVAIDFSIGGAVRETALSIQIPWVLGTTGWDKEEILPIVERRRIPLVHAPNFSIGMALFRRLVRMGDALFDGFDRKGVEIHHTKKRDAPSGTALRLMEDVRGLEFSSVREGNEVGTHQVMFQGKEERIELIHRATDRKVFARGAVLAARWLMGTQGIYTFEECLECNLVGSQQL